MQARRKYGTPTATHGGRIRCRSQVRMALWPAASTAAVLNSSEMRDRQVDRRLDLRPGPR